MDTTAVRVLIVDDDAATRLKCVNAECSLVYPIRDEIPVMLIDEATVEK